MIHILVLFLFKLQFIQAFSQPSSWKPGESSGAFILKKYDDNFDDFLAKLYGKLPNDSMIQDYMEKKEIFTITKPSVLNSKWTISVKGGNFLVQGYLFPPNRGGRGRLYPPNRLMAQMSAF